MKEKPPACENLLSVGTSNVFICAGGAESGRAVFLVARRVVRDIGTTAIPGLDAEFGARVFCHGRHRQQVLQAGETGGEARSTTANTDFC